MCTVLKLFSMLCFMGVCLGSRGPTIGIIGGGIGGTSAAYFLRELFGENIKKLDVFERKKIGGRIALEKLAGCNYEAGGTILHPRNKYMDGFRTAFEMEKRVGKDSAFGLYNGKEFVYVEDSNWGFWNSVKLLWRYGFDSLKVKQIIDSLVEYFSRIYIFQDNQETYESVDDLLNAMKPDFVKDLHISCKEGFQESGVSQRVIDELVMATIMVNYGQTTSVHKFVASVSIAGAMPGLWSVKGGNIQIPERLLEISNASVIKGNVDRVTMMLDSGNYKVSWKTGSGEKKDGVYDIVIVATPLAKNIKESIEFVNFSSIISFPEVLHKTVATFIVGNFNSSYFGLKSSRVNEVFSINSDLFFNSIGEIYPVDDMGECSNAYAWKIFSKEPLQREQLEKVFSDIKDVKSIPWLAYPKYSTSPYKRKFILNKNLYYINAIEWAASAMEMSVVGARNVALLAFKSWSPKKAKERAKMKSKNEL